MFSNFVATDAVPWRHLEQATRENFQVGEVITALAIDR
jgi:hypothetical protein